jgi:hypothetical protein
LILTSNTTETTGNLVYSKVVPMGIDAASFGIILDSLIRIYSNPYVAALREYTSNAWDSHHNSTPTRPIEVALPSMLSPVFTVEDFGVGMDRIQLGQYGQFGFSTKRDDNENIGGYGLGSKVGLAFASQYTVRAVKDGYVNTVVIGRDENSNPQMGFINGPVFPENATEEERELIELAYPGEPTDLPNGVKIAIPTMEYRKFSEALSNHFFLGFAPGTILIDGKEPTYSVHNKAQFQEIGDGLGWRRAKGAQHNVGGVALIHGVSYSINWSEIARDLSYDVRTGFLSEVVVEINNGDIEIQRSRESLVYSKTTTAVLGAKLKSLLAYATEQYKKEIANAPTYREAVQLRRKAISFGFKADYTWRGQTIKTRIGGMHPLASVDLTHVSVNYGGNSSSGLLATKYLISLKKFVDYHAEKITEDTRTTILVYGSKDPQEVRNRTVHVESNGSSSYTEFATKAENSPRPDSFEFVFTSLSEKKLPTWFKSYFGQVISVDEFMETVTAMRKERAAEAAAYRKENAAPKVIKTGLHVRKMFLRDGGRSTLVELPADQLDPTHTHVLIQIGAGELADKLIAGLMSIRSAKGYQVSLLKYLEESQNFTFLYATKSVKVDKYTKEVPNFITASELPKAMEDIAKSIIAKKSENQKRGIIDRNSGDVNWALRLHAKGIASVQNKETREWLEILQNQRSEDDDFLRSVENWGHLFGITPGVAKITSTAVSPNAYYPIMQDFTVRSSNYDIVADYINLVDKAMGRI